MYFFYALWVTPLVQRPVAEDERPQARAKVSTVKRGQKSEQAEKHLPHAPWAIDAPYQYQSSEKDRYIFTETREQTPEGQMKFSPFAMVVFDLDKPDEKPYTLVSNSAVIEFQNGLEFKNNFQPGRIVGLSF